MKERAIRNIFLSFYILILLLHPTQEDWALGYSHDQKVSSMSYFHQSWLFDTVRFGFGTVIHSRIKLQAVDVLSLLIPVPKAL
jgi:hypothetical protein